jgi:hypothetical protein
MAFGPSLIRFLRRPTERHCSGQVPKKAVECWIELCTSFRPVSVRRVGQATPHLPLINGVSNLLRQFVREPTRETNDPSFAFLFLLQS